MVAVGTWNLYRPGGRFGPKTRAAYDAKLGTLAATITRLAPDVLAVQEVGQPEALADLVDLLGGSWTAVLSEHPDARGIRVGFLSTVEPVSTAQVVDFPVGVATDPGRRRRDRQQRGHGPRRGPPAGDRAGDGLGPAHGAPQIEAADLPGRPVRAGERGSAGQVRCVRVVPASR